MKKSTVGKLALISLALSFAITCKTFGPQSTVESVEGHVAPTQSSSGDVCTAACSASPARSLSTREAATKKAICYSCRCKAAFDNYLPSPDELRCSAAKEIMTYKLEQSDDGTFKKTALDSPSPTCLNPARLPDVPSDVACMPGSRLGQMNKGDLFFKWICRRKKDAPNLRDPIANSAFDDFGLIGYNAKNGLTCYWDDIDGKSDGENLPNLDLTTGDPQLVNRFLDGMTHTEGSSCKSCHDNDPFMYSPYLENVWSTSSAYTNGKYLQVKSDSSPVHATAYFLDSPEVQECTSCHRIAYGGSTCKKWVADLAGSRTQDRPFQKLTDGAKINAFQEIQWMPPRDSMPGSLKEWHEQYDAEISTIEKCCAESPLTNGRSHIPGCAWKKAK